MGIIQFRKILIVSMQVGVDVKCMRNKFDDFDSFFTICRSSLVCLPMETIKNRNGGRITEKKVMDWCIHK